MAPWASLIGSCTDSAGTSKPARDREYRQHPVAHLAGWMIVPTLYERCVDIV